MGGGVVAEISRDLHKRTRFAGGGYIFRDLHKRTGRPAMCLAFVLQNMFDDCTVHSELTISRVVTMLSHRSCHD